MDGSVYFNKSAILMFLLLDLCCTVIYSKSHNVHSMAVYLSNLEELVLFCPWSGNDSSHAWLHNNKLMYSGKHPLHSDPTFSLEGGNYSLEIKNASLSHEGRYICKSDENIVEYNLVMKVKPIDFYMNVNKKNVSDGAHLVLDAAMNITARCHVVSERPEAIIIWMVDNGIALRFNGTLIKSNETDTFNVYSEIHHRPKVHGGNITCSLESFSKEEKGYVISVQYSTNSDSPSVTVPLKTSGDMLQTTHAIAVTTGVITLLLLSCVVAFAFGFIYVKGLPMRCSAESSNGDECHDANVLQEVEMDSGAPNENPETMNGVTKNIKREDVILHEQLPCNGAMVYWLATWSSPKEADEFKFIAKSVSDSAQVSDMKNFHDLATHLLALGTHDNIVDVFGTIVDNLPYYIYQEYVECGTLRNFLFRNYQSETECWENNKKIEHSQKGSSTQEQKELIQFAMDVIDGMVHLSEHKFRHPCLRISKVLVASTGKCKLYDFITEELAKDKLLQIIGKKPPPTAWLSPEFIFLRQYCEKADVWSLAVALWEIFSLGETPYPGLSGEEIETEIRNAKYLRQPMSCPGSVFGIMLSCWDISPPARPSFQEIQQNLREILSSMLLDQETSADITETSGDPYATLDDTASCNSYI